MSAITFSAYDAQPYLPFDPLEAGNAMDRPNNDLADTRTWMHANILQLNTDKVERLLTGKPEQVTKIQSLQSLHQATPSFGRHFC